MATIYVRVNRCQIFMTQMDMIWRMAAIKIEPFSQLTLFKINFKVDSFSGIYGCYVYMFLTFFFPLSEVVTVHPGDGERLQ